MADFVKIAEFSDVRGAFHCEHKPGTAAANSPLTVEKGQAVLCPACTALHAAGASQLGDGYGLRQTAFGGWVKTKAAAK